MQIALLLETSSCQYMVEVVFKGKGSEHCQERRDMPQGHVIAWKRARISDAGWGNTLSLLYSRGASVQALHGRGHLTVLSDVNNPDLYLCSALTDGTGQITKEHSAYT